MSKASHNIKNKPSIDDLSFLAICLECQSPCMSISSLNKSIDEHDCKGCAQFSGNLLNLSKKDEFSLCIQGCLLIKSHKFNNAKNVFEIIIILNPNCHFAKIQYADVLVRQEFFGEAIKIYKKVLKTHPTRKFLWIALGKAYAKLEDYSKALPSIKRALEIDPEDGTALNILADVYHNLSEFTKAEDIFKKLLKENPCNELILAKYGWLLSQNLRYGEKIKILSRLLKIHQNEPYLWLNLGFSYLDDNKPKNALLSFYKVTQLRPFYLRAYEGLKFSYDSITKRDKQSYKEESELYWQALKTILKDKTLMAWIELQKFEEELRDFIQRELVKKYDQDWWKVGIPKNIQKEVRKYLDRKKKLFPHKAFDKIHMLGISHFTQIMQENWDGIFSKTFKIGIYSVIEQLNDIRIFRNCIAHSHFPGVYLSPHSHFLGVDLFDFELMIHEFLLSII